VKFQNIKGTEEMTEDLRSRMSRFVEFINSADENIGREIVSDSAIFYVPFRTEPLRGLAGFLGVIRTMRQAFPDVQWSLEETIVEGATVAARFVMRGTHQGEFFGVPATGKRVQVQAMNIYRFADGRIVEEYGFPDLMVMMMQIGAVDLPAGAGHL
jgi:steroid delta-isomerase-like uncharacterized protein